jgi:hypothetical protein
MAGDAVGHKRASITASVHSAKGNLRVGSDLPVLRTSHLVIRPVGMHDLEACHRLYMDIGWEDKDLTEVQNREARRRWIEWSVLNEKQLALLNNHPMGTER